MMTSKSDMNSLRKTGNLVVISGPSGSGKGTICRALFKIMPELRLSISATTRKPRSGERDGIDYYFLSKAEFEAMIEAGKLLEWAKVYGNYYGTPAEPVMKSINEGRDVILEIDVQGAFQVREKYPGCILIFLIPPSRAELEHRLKSRATDSEEEIQRRLTWVEREVAQLGKYDYLVINDKVEKAARTVSAIITAERCRPALLDTESLLEKYR